MRAWARILIAFGGLAAAGCTGPRLQRELSTLRMDLAALRREVRVQREQTERAIAGFSLRDAVARKLRRVYADYRAFARSYGPVLEERWLRVAEDLTFGGEGRLSRVATELDKMELAMIRPEH